jgi:hypothetical protein
MSKTSISCHMLGEFHSVLDRMQVSGRCIASKLRIFLCGNGKWRQRVDNQWKIHLWSVYIKILSLELIVQKNKQMSIKSTITCRIFTVVQRLHSSKCKIQAVFFFLSRLIAVFELHTLKILCRLSSIYYN